MGRWSGRFATWYRSALGFSLRGSGYRVLPPALSGPAACSSNLQFFLVEADNQPDIAAFSVGPNHPLGLIDQRLDQEHAHPARVLLAMHLLVDVRLGGRRLDAFAVVHHLHLQSIRAG